jgi:hypothetical protein
LRFRETAALAAVARRLKAYGRFASDRFGHISVLLLSAIEFLGGRGGTHIAAAVGLGGHNLNTFRAPIQRI